MSRLFRRISALNEPYTVDKSGSAMCDEFGNTVYKSAFETDCGASSQEEGASCQTRLEAWNETKSRSGGGGADYDPDTVTDDDDKDHAVSKIPWHLRTVEERDETYALGIVFSKYFWGKVDYAFRATIVAFLPVAALVAGPDTKNFFVSQSFATLGALMGAVPSFGGCLFVFAQFVKGAFFWLPFCTAMIAGELWKHEDAWNCVYAFGCFCICVFARGFTSRLCLIFFNICMMSQMSSPIGRSLTFPSHAMAELLVGFGFAIVSCFIPFPKLSSRFVDTSLEECAAQLESCIPFIHRSFWAKNVTERNIVSRRLSTAVKAMEFKYNEVLPMHLGMSFYEMFFLGVQRQLLRKSKVELFRKLLYRLACLSRVVELMRELQVLVTPMTDLHGELNAKLSVALDALTQDLCCSMSGVAKAQSRSDAVKVMNVSNLNAHMQLVHDLLEQIRAELFHNVDYRVNERVSSIVGFYLFGVSQFVTALDEFAEQALDDSKWPGTVQVICFFFVSSVTESLALIKSYFHPTSVEVRAIVEAVKTSGSMIAAVRFFIFMNAQTAFLSGPTVIAFCAGDTAGDAVNGAFMRIVGVMMGCVLGFFADSYSDTQAKKVASICTILFVCNWLREGKKFGNAAFFAGFNVLSMIALKGSISSVVLTTKIQQNTFAVLIYCLAALLLWPPKPLQALREQRSRTIKGLTAAFETFLGMFATPLSNPEALKHKMALIQEQITVARTQLQLEQALLAPAEEEPFCAPELFPAPLNRDLHTTERKLVLTLEICLGAWSHLVHKGRPDATSRLEPFLLSLSPVAADVAIALRATTNVVREIVLNPFASLNRDLLTEGTLCMALAHQLNQRMASGFVHLVVSEQSERATGRIASPENRVLISPGGYDESATRSPAAAIEPREGTSPSVPPAAAGCPFRTEELEAIHSIRHSLATFVEQYRLMAIAANEMHAFDEATNSRLMM